MNNKQNFRQNSQPDAFGKKHYDALQTRKLLSAYGGVGSLVETRDGAFVVSPFDHWAFGKKHWRKDEFRIEDPRLFSRLRKYFTQLDRLVRLPVNDFDQFHQPERQGQTAAANIFPRWFFCPLCHRFDTVDNWLRHWRNAHSDNEKKRNAYFPLKCFRCSEKRNVELEQVRFVLTSPNGNVADVPWRHWVFAKMRPGEAPVSPDGDAADHDGGNPDDGKRPTRLDWNVQLPPNFYLQYTISDKFNSLLGINIVARQPGSGKPEDDPEIARQTLEGIFNLRVEEWEVLPEERPNTSWMKPVIRSSTSVYYPNLLQSLFLPVETGLPSADVIQEIKDLHEEDIPPTKICSLLLKRKGVEVLPSQIESWVAQNFQPLVDAPLEEIAYRFGEYRFLTSNSPRFDDLEGRLSFEEVPKSNYELPGVALPGIAKILRVDKLKMTVVQTSYTRQEPLDRDYFLKADEVKSREGGLLRKKYTSTFKQRTQWLPAVENQGEGIFFEFDPAELEIWQANEEIRRRAAAVQDNYERTKLNLLEMRDLKPKYLLIHTFSHLIIKELEFLCGYPATSLQERLYLSPEMQGVLIYVVAGAEGSYGGLVSLCQSEKVGKLLHSALLRATDCASDPVCWHADEQHGQGLGGTNLAACFSCALLPETYCEEFNRFLDRRLLVDKEFGFFKDIIKNTVL